jgi:hypothetical protein
MNRGLLLYHSGAVNACLDLFELRVWESGVPHPTVPKVAPKAEDAIRSFNPHAQNITWLSGPAATRKLAKAVGLEFRKRAPGGGRKKAEPGHKVVYVPVWMTPAGLIRLDFLRGKRARGAFIEAHLALMK